MKRSDGTPIRPNVTAALGGLVGAVLMGGIGYSHGTDMALGASFGAILGAILGRGVVTGTTGPATVVAVLFALFFCLIGPGYDDVGGILAIPTAGFGWCVGRVGFGRRRYHGRRDELVEPSGAAR
jgi:hypothetical protein